MLVCSCNFISKTDIETVVLDFLEKDAWQLITAGMVYHAIEKRGKCCGCFPQVIAIIIETTRAVHAKIGSPDSKILPFIAKIKSEYDKFEAIRHQTRLDKTQRNAA